MTKPTLTTTVISDLAWQQLTDMDAPANSPIASTVAGVAPVQSWEETDQVLPNIGQVDNELLAAAGLSNTILISVKTDEVLKTITVSIGANGNWFVGGVDTGVPAKGTDEKSIARPSGVYGAAPVFQVGNTLTIGAGLMYGVKEGANFYTLTTTGELNLTVDGTTTFVTIDRVGTVRTYSSGVNLWNIPESQALIALVTDTDGVTSSFAVPTVHNAMLMASAVIPYTQSAIEAAASATLQATISAQFAEQSRQSAVAAEAAKLVTSADAAITTTNAQLTEQWKLAAAASAASAQQSADFADADRVATSADRAQVAADKAAVATDRSAVAVDKSVVAADKAITQGFKNDALGARNLAAEYAMKPEDSVITGTASDYSALHWAQKAQQWAQVGSSTLVWKGQWSATGNAAPPTPVVGSGAHFYRISGAGVISGTEYAVGDYIHWDSIGRVWFKIDGTDAVVTVCGKFPVGGNVALAPQDVGADAAGTATAAVATHSAGTNVHSIAAVAGLQASLDSKYSPANKPTPDAIGALLAEAGVFTGNCNSLITKGRFAINHNCANWPFTGNGGVLNVFQISVDFIVQVAISGGNGAQATRTCGMGVWGIWNPIYSAVIKPLPVEIGALAASSYKPRSDSLNNTELLIPPTTGKDMNTCQAGDYGLYELASCPNSPAGKVGAYFYCETMSIYNFAMVQRVWPYDFTGYPCYRNFSVNTLTWGPWRLYNDRGTQFNGSMSGNPTGGGFATVYNRNDTPFTTEADISGDVYAAALGLRYVHNGGWAGVYHMGTLCENSASAGKLIIGHINGGGGQEWNLSFDGANGHAVFPSTMSAVDYLVRSDRSVKDNFEPIVGALDKVASLEVAVYDKYSDTSKTTKLTREYGTIANSLQAVDELLVARDGGLLFNSVSGQLALLTAAIQELKIKTGV